MNRNSESHFANLPDIDIQRSVMSRPSEHLTTFNTGDLIPLYLDEILPGDTVRMKTSKVLRLQTLLTPIYGNIYFDTYWFFVPNRLVWNHWQNFCGENSESAWTPTTEYTIPKISPPSGGFSKGTIADYFGIPTNVSFTPGGSSGNLNYDHYPSALPFRAYALICDQFFRDEALTDPLNIPLGDAMQTGTNGANYINDVANGGQPFKACKYHDYFTSCLPQAQRGTSVQVPIPGGFSGDLALKYFDNVTPPSSYDNLASFPWRLNRYTATDSTASARLALDTANPSDPLYTGVNATTVNTQANSTPTSQQHYLGFENFGVTVPGGQQTAFSISDLRVAFQAQKYLERNARAGGRYISVLRSHFGVTSPDARLQRAEYLGGKRVPISVHQVTNTANTASDFLGDVGAQSVTQDYENSMEHSFTEHGYLICVGVARYDHIYAQGLERHWTRNSLYDFYWPVFANIGEQPVKSDEIYCDGSAPDVFGYQEYAADYRYKPNRVSGEFRPGITGSLASWHLADHYATKPTLSDGWIREDKTNVDRVLAVTSSVSNQILGDFYFDATYTRPMPMYSIPGMIDHN